MAATATRTAPKRGRSSTYMRKHPWLYRTWVTLRVTYRVSVWTGRQIGRGIGWAAPRAARGAATYSKAVTRPYRERAQTYAKHGRVPMVLDLSSGEWIPAAQVNLAAPGGGDPDLRQLQRGWAVQQQHRRQVARENLGGGLAPRLTWWERLVMRAQHRDVAGREQLMMRARMAVAARQANALAAAAERHWPTPEPDDPFGRIELPEQRTGRTHDYDHAEVWVNSDFVQPDPVPVDLDKVNTGGAMANSVRTFDDLNDPGIDPFEYPEQLPEHYGEVEGLLGQEAAEIEALADGMQRKADSLRAYAEYMQGAEVDGDALAGVLESAETYENAAAAARQHAEQVQAAADLMGAAKRGAEAQYGDQKVLRFDKVS